MHPHTWLVDSYLKLAKTAVVSPVRRNVAQRVLAAHLGLDGLKDFRQRSLAVNFEAAAAGGLRQAAQKGAPGKTRLVADAVHDRIGLFRRRNGFFQLLLAAVVQPVRNNHQNFAPGYIHQFLMSRSIDDIVKQSSGHRLPVGWKTSKRDRS